MVTGEFIVNMQSALRAGRASCIPCNSMALARRDLFSPRQSKTKNFIGCKFMKYIADIF